MTKKRKSPFGDFLSFKVRKNLKKRQTKSDCDYIKKIYLKKLNFKSYMLYDITNDQVSTSGDAINICTYS